MTRRDGTSPVSEVPSRDAEGRGGGGAWCQAEMVETLQLPGRLPSAGRVTDIKLRCVGTGHRTSVGDRRRDGSNVRGIEAGDRQVGKGEGRVRQAETEGKQGGEVVRLVPAVADVDALVVVNLIVRSG